MIMHGLPSYKLVSVGAMESRIVAVEDVNVCQRNREQIYVRPFRLSDSEKVLGLFRASMIRECKPKCNVKPKGRLKNMFYR